jgi:hypothetical protein
MKALLIKTIQHRVNIELSGYDLAELFWNSDEQQQAAFFNYLGLADHLCFQLQAVTASSELTTSGRHAMHKIGDYADKI